MWKFKVPEMTCGHCVRAVTNAAQGVDPSAKVDVDLSTKIVAVESDADEHVLSDAIRATGYENEVIAR